jgi:hypothetical protein
LEELDRVAGGVVEQDLLAARAGDHVVAEAQSGGPQPFDLSGKIVDDQVNAVPTAGVGGAAVGHRSSGRAGGTAQQQTQLAPDDVRERGRGAGAELEAEVRGVEGDGLFHVVDHVTDTDELVVHAR